MDERPVRRGGPREFEDLMTRGERLATGVYLPVHSVLMPLVLSALSVMSAGALDNLTLNAIMYSAGTLFTLLFLHKFLRRSFDVLAENLSRCVLTLFSALAVDFALSWLLSLVLALFGIVLGSNANNDAVVGLALEGHNRMFAITVFLAPMAEEPLFRGLLFGGVRRHSRAAAYIVSVFMFGFYHVWQYLFIFEDWRYLLQMLSYVPVSVALCYSYERSGCIWVPIAFHMFINALSMSLLV